IAMLNARLIDVKVLPSPGIALVIRMRLPFSTLVDDLRSAFVNNGRLMTRYSSASCERGESGVTYPIAASRARSISIDFDCRDEVSNGLSLRACGAGRALAAGSSTTGAAALLVRARATVVSGSGVGVRAAAVSLGRMPVGSSTPALRSSSRRFAAWSMMLIRFPSGRCDQPHPCNPCTEHEQQHRKRAAECEVSHAPPADSGRTGSEGNDAKHGPLADFAQGARAVDGREDLRKQKAGEQARGQRTEQRDGRQCRMVREHRLRRDARRIDYSEIRKLRGGVHVLRDGRRLAPRHQAFVVLAHDFVVAV